jgi:hypothetical protein
MLTMKKLIWALSLPLLLMSCATSPNHPKTEIEQYVENVSAKISPVWKDAVKTRVKNLASRGLSPIALPPPSNEIFVSVAIAPDGTIKEVVPLKKSKYAFLNLSAVKVWKDSSPLNAPANPAGSNTGGHPAIFIHFPDYVNVEGNDFDHVQGNSVHLMTETGWGGGYTSKFPSHSN